jgi:arylsulfatase A-like enzyme
MDWSHGHNQGLINGVGRIGWMRGGRAAVWDDTTMGDVFAAQACAWIKTQAQSKQPFFLFYAAHENHVPRVVHPRHVGKTPLGPRGDAIVAFDEQVGQLMEALEKAGVADQTLVLVTSDNGPVLDDGYQDEAFERNRAAGHLPAGPFRGGKYSAHQGGTRVPLVVRWAHVVPSGLVVDSIVSQVDFPALFARVAGGDPSPFIKLDSANLDATSLLSGSARDHVVSHASGNRFSLRVGEWLYLRDADAQNFTTFHGPGYRSEPGTQGEQLFNLKQDPGERVNLAERHPEKVEELRQRLKQLQDRGLAQPLPL